MEGGSRERRIIIQDPLADDVLELKKIVDEMSRNAKNQQNDLDVIQNFLIEKEIRYTETINSNIKIIHQYESFMNQLKKLVVEYERNFGSAENQNSAEETEGESADMLSRLKKIYENYINQRETKARIQMENDELLSQNRKLSGIAENLKSQISEMDARITKLKLELRHNEEILNEKNIILEELTSYKNEKNEREKTYLWFCSLPHREKLLPFIHDQSYELFVMSCGSRDTIERIYKLLRLYIVIRPDNISEEDLNDIKKILQYCMDFYNQGTSNHLKRQEIHAGDRFDSSEAEKTEASPSFGKVKCVLLNGIAEEKSGGVLCKSIVEVE